MGILIKLPPKKEHIFRELAMKKFNYRKGALSLALNEAIDLWISQEFDFNHNQIETLTPVNQLILKLKQILPELKSKYSVIQIGVFGSYIRNEQTPQSDIDILVEFEKTPGLLKFIELKDYLTKYLGIKVDLVTKRNIKPEIQSQILEETLYVNDIGMK